MGVQGNDKATYSTRSAAAFGLGLMVLPLCAWSNERAWDWQASVGVLTDYSNNAFKSSDEEISERQDEARLAVGADYENNLVEFSSNYQARERRFDKGSQEGRSQLEGNSELIIGKAHHRADLRLSHTRRSVLNQPDDLDLLRNNDERQIFSAVPTLRWRLTQADLVMLQGSYAQVDYRFNSERDSERLGGNLIWRRSLSSNETVTLLGQYSDVSFDAFPLADYSYYAYSAAYGVELRRLDYRIELGYNETDPEQGEGMDGPSYQVDVGYDSGLHRWSLSLAQFVTDNSAGSGNRGDFDGFNPGDSSAGDLDQLERFRADIRWTTSALCVRCESSLTLFYQEDDYRIVTEDRSEHGLRLNNRYRLSTRSSVSASLERRESRFSQEVARSDFTADRVGLSYDYDFPSGLSAGASARWEQRSYSDAASARDYDEAIVGLRLNYRFR